MSARRPAGKHRRPGKHRRASSSPSPQVLLGTAVFATAAAALLANAPTQALGDTKKATLAPEPQLHLAAAVATPAPTPTPTPSVTAKAKAKPRSLTPVKAKVIPFDALLRSSRASRSSARRELPKVPAAPLWVRPVSGYSLTASFGDGGGYWSHGHTGQDFAAPSGTPVLAVGAGEVVSAEYAGAYGYRVIVRHSDGTETWYCHLSSFDVVPGATLRPGQLLGRVGSTGNSTGPHLHFEVRPLDSEAVDPMPWLRAQGVKI